MNDAKKDLEDLQRSMYLHYEDNFQSALDDTAVYLSRFEAHQTAYTVHYQQEKQILFDLDALNVFYNNLALKYGIENNEIAIQNLKLHIPAIVIYHYNGYFLVTLDDSDSNLKTIAEPIRPYWYKLKNGNIIYFKLDDQATVYDRSANVYYQGDYEQLSTITNLDPLTTIEGFREVRQTVITTLVEEDLSAAINQHMELVKRLGLSISFTLPKGLEQQSIKDIGMMAFIQGYPLPGGELLETYAYGAGSVISRKVIIGTKLSSGKYVAYGAQCMPTNGVTEIERFYDPVEAVSKGYYYEDCSG